MKKKFIKFADLPPNPFSKDDLKRYKDLGLNVCLLTEDDVKLVKDGKLSDEYKSAINNIGEQGLEVWIRNMFNDESYFQSFEKIYGSNYGSEYEMEPRNITDEFAQFDCVTGFYMADEAYMYNMPETMPISWMRPRTDLFSTFEKLTKLVDWKNKYYPDKFFHINHVPSQSWDHYLPRNGQFYDYEDFLTYYNDTILKGLKSGPHSLCLDNYPFIGEDYLEKDYLFDLMTAANLARDFNTQNPKNKTTFGICIQSFHCYAITDERHRDIKLSAEVKFQIYVGMALGAKMLEYFCYRSYERLEGIIGPNNENRIYDIVKTANEEASVFEDAIYDFTYIGAFAVPGYKCTENTAAFIMAKELYVKDSSISVSSECDLLVSRLENGDEKGYMIVNYTDPVKNHTTIVNVKFTEKSNINLLTQEENKSLKDTCEFVIILKPGQAAFITKQ